MTVQILVKGKVQGVFYRASTKAKAKELSLTGFVQNQSDGSVLIETEGDEKDIGKLKEWCQIGPPGAEVDSCDVKQIQNKNFKEFTIK